MLQLNPIFANGIVLAANKPIRIFGNGCGSVSVSFLGETVAKAVTDDWCIELSARPCGGPYTMEISLDGKQTRLSDVYVGEVILLSGQSNIQFKMHESKDLDAICEPCEALRTFSLERIEKSEFYRPEDGWVVCKDADVIKNWSAIGYEVGLAVCKQKGCAIGLIACYQGASVIQSWMPVGTADRLGIHIPTEALHIDHSNYSLWNGDGVLYETMLQRLMPYSLSHVIWYQGESNATPAEGAVYKDMLTEMIRIWREDFDDKALPFIIVQLANNDSRMRRHNGWILVQAAQMKIQDAVANVKAVVCKDVCESNDIHPPTKRYLSERIADVINKM